MGDLDVRDGFAMLFDGGNEVGPKQGNVVAIGFFKLRVTVHALRFFVGRVEGPSVAPADVEDAFFSVEVGADLVLFGAVVGELAVLPGDR